jgi:hypothetical protein
MESIAKKKSRKSAMISMQFLILLLTSPFSQST